MRFYRFWSGVIDINQIWSEKEGISAILTVQEESSSSRDPSLHDDVVLKKRSKNITDLTEDERRTWHSGSKTTSVFTTRS